MGVGFAPYLATLVPHLCGVIIRIDTTEVTLPGEGGYDLSALKDEDEEGRYPPVNSNNLQVRFLFSFFFFLFCDYMFKGRIETNVNRRRAGGVGDPPR
jgi:hypothetical protein